ncbi:MAG: hypothetical protein WGN25_15815 [Candidatus Electrothrix sp. GW3-4]|uniref:hypothetical protein n=1 Tax=Candidatus Electrothrix sp. GW3-4 TaxID=3126740 RepID=UPI0030D603E5
MNLLKYISIGIVLIGVLTGCGKNTVETLMVPAQVDPNGRGKDMSVVILPFADYSNGDNIASAFRRNILITESLTDNLTINGFRLTVQEDVFEYLLDQGIISSAPYDDSGSVSLVNELKDPDWSDVMKEKLQGYMQHQNIGSSTARPNGPGTHGLTSQEVVKIGRQFGVDYIIRGRILEFRTRQEHTWAPWKRGILPFAIGSTSRMAFGFADSATYDNWDNILAGGTWGTVVGASANNPWNPDDSKGFLGISGGEGANTIAWAAAGAMLGDMAQHGGRVDQAVVQMRIWVQSAYDASIVWTNRVDVRVSPESVLADNQYDTLFEHAIRKATTALMNNFVLYGLP